MSNTVKGNQATVVCRRYESFEKKRDGFENKLKGRLLFLSGGRCARRWVKIALLSGRRKAFMPDQI